MFRKVLLPVLAAVLIAVSFSGTALAAEGDGEGLLKARGKVIDINTSAGKFSIHTPGGEDLRFFVDEDTRYAGQISSLEDLEIGMVAGVAYTEQGQGKLTAVGLVAGRAPDLIKVKGEVTAIDAGLGKFEVVTAEGTAMRFFVDENTRYQGQLSSLEELRVGWRAGVAAKEGEDGKLTAVLVIAGIRPEVVRVQGVIADVNPAASTFQLEKPDGDILTFQVTENTNFRGQVSNIADLKEGLRAAIGGYEDSQGELIARVVVAGELPDERPEIIRAQGSLKTVSPGAGKFQLEKSDGSVVTVYVNENTRYRGQVEGFDDLEKDMRAGFIGYLDHDGNIIARVVVAGKPPSGRSDGDRPLPESDFPRESLPLPPSS
ncbi:MAG: DUF5666 domain-containing protein [Anaerolineales bacterium]